MMMTNKAILEKNPPVQGLSESMVPISFLRKWFQLVEFIFIKPACTLNQQKSIIEKSYCFFHLDDAGILCIIYHC